MYQIKAEDRNNEVEGVGTSRALASTYFPQV